MVRSSGSGTGMTAGVRSVLTVNTLVVATIAVSFVNSIVIAAFFGLTRRIDAYYAALMLPNLFLVLGVDYLGKNFLPTLVRARREGGEIASELTSTIVTIVALLALAAALGLALGSKALFALLLPGFGPEELELVSRSFWIMAPALVFAAVTPFHEYVVQQDDRYARIIMIRAALPLANLAAIVAVGPFVGEYALPIGYTVGQAITFALMAWQARYRYRPRFIVRREWERKIFTNSAIVMSSGLIMRTRIFVANYLASLLGDGAIAALNFTRRLTEPLERSTFTGVKMLMFNRAARLAARNDRAALGKLYGLGVTASFMMLAPLLWWLALESAAIIGTLFERGAFGPAMTAVVAATLVAFVPSVVFFGANALLSNAFYALDRVTVPAITMPIGTGVYLAVAPFVYRPLGVPGLALAASAAALVVFLLLVYCLSRQVEGFRAGAVLGKILWYGAAGGAALAAAKLALAGVESAPLRAGAALVLGAPLYLGLLALVRDRTLLELWGRFRRNGAPAAVEAVTPPAR